MTLLEILTTYTVWDMRRPEEPDGLHWQYKWRDGLMIFTFTDDVDVIRLRREAEFIAAYMRPWLTSEQVRTTVQWSRLADGRREGAWPGDPSCIHVHPRASERPAFRPRPGVCRRADRCGPGADETTTGGREMLNEKIAPSEGAPMNDSALILRHFPEHDTCAGRLFVELLQGREVTHRTFDGTAHTMRTAVYIRRLRVWGWPIATEMRDGRNAFEPVRFAAYRLVGVEIGPREEMYIATAKKETRP